MKVVKKENLVTIYADEKGKLNAKIELPEDGIEITLKNCKEQYGHDDSLPYVASVYVNGKKLGIAFNDGWGGETNLNPDFTSGDARVVYNKFYDKLDKYNAIAKKYQWKFRNETFNYSNIGEMVDELAGFVIDIQELNKKIKPKLKENYVSVRYLDNGKIHLSWQRKEAIKNPKAPSEFVLING